MRRTTLFILAVSAAAIAGCTLEHPGIAIGKQVTVETLEAGKFAGRFKASVVSGGEASGLDYAGALLEASGRSCKGSYLVEDQSPRLQDMNAIIPAGEEVSMTVACGHDRLPGHRIVSKGGANEVYGATPEGLSDKMAFAPVGKNENRRLVGERLVGGFLREVYTEQCAGKAVVVEKIVMVSEPTQPTATLPNVENLHVAMHYRCVDANAGTASVASKTRP